MGARFGTLLLDGRVSGLVQLGEVGLFGKAIHMLCLDRGPLWFDGVDAGSANVVFFREFARQFRKRFGRKVRVIPEWSSSCPRVGEIEDSGAYRKSTTAGYQTIWLDLDPNLETLRSNLSGKWRNVLVKSERSSLVVEEDWSLRTGQSFLLNYDNDRRKKGYPGPKVAFVRSLMGFSQASREAVILNAKLDGKTVAAILLFLHGSSATYQVGWTTSSGRKQGAHHLLLWSALGILKDRQILDFDLGGINDDAAPGVSKFKMGLGGEPVQLAGLFN